MPNEIPLLSRRRLLKYGGSVFVMGVMGAFSKSSSTRSQGLTESKDRSGWRFCNKCQVMFYTDAESNSCAAGKTHVPQGYKFRLPFDIPETSTAQKNWRSCNKCQAMFFNGYRGKGRCPAGKDHIADNTFRYVLTHDIAETPTAQKDWRFCSKCYAMFYNGYSGKGRCAAGEGHVAQGFNFVLPHPR